MNAMHAMRVRSFLQPLQSPAILWRTLVAMVIVILIAGWPVGRANDSAVAAAPDNGGNEQPLSFTRVHVPAGRLSDIPVGTMRYVPMSAREFEEGVARLSAGGRGARDEELKPFLTALADAARYQISRAEDGSLTGTISFDIGEVDEAPSTTGLPRIGLPRPLPLGTLEVRSASMQTAAGLGEAVVYGRPDGTLAMVATEAGTYRCDFRCAAESGSDDAPHFSLPLVPALSSSITLRLPRGLQPLVGGDVRVSRLREVTPDPAAVTAVRQVPATVAWQLDTGPRQTIELTLVADERPAPMLSMWTDVGIRGRQANVEVLVQPLAPWFPGTIRIEKDPAVLVTKVAVGGRRDAMDERAWTVAEEGTELLIELPRRSVGGREPLVITAVAPVPDNAAPLPLLRLPVESWSGGGIAIQTSPSLSVSAIDLEHGLVVPAEVTVRWPLPAALASEPVVGVTVPHAESDLQEAAPGIQPSRLFVEEQAAGVTVRLSLLPRTVDLDVVRVTTIDLSPGVVVGRAACDVRVLRGECFDLTARITPGWFIDSVESFSLATSAEPADTSRRRSGDEPVADLDWKVLRDVRGDVLRIGLTTATTTARGLGLRITGHRAGIALEEDFSTTEIDMVRLDGESKRSSLIDLRTSPETTVEFAASSASDQELMAAADATQADFQAVEPDSRLSTLMEEGTARTRVWAGFLAASRTARLVRRRPPLDARTEVRLTVRDDRLTEAVTFECHPAASDLDSIVVQFSEPVDDLLEWSLLPPAIGTVAARRLDSSDRRTATGGVTGAERWLVELNPPARGAVTIRAARTIPFVRATPMLLAWVDGATSTVGHVLVRNVGRLRPQVVNRRLTEVPAESALAESAAVTLAEFSFEPSAAPDSADLPAAELAPGGDDARAWACREVATSWCHSSGATEYETLFDIDNHGRISLSLTIPPGRRVQGILLDGVRLPLGERAAAGGQVPITLPAGRPLVTLLVRTVVDHDSVTGRLGNGLWSAWRVAPPGVKLDIPVLQREWRMFVPPELEIAWVGGSSRCLEGEDRRDWVARLLGAAVQPLVSGGVPRTASFTPGQLPQAPNPAGPLLPGFRESLVVPTGDAGVMVVHARILSAAAIAVGLAAGCGGLWLARWSLQGTAFVCLLAGVAALWVAAPFDGIARVAWWASLAALALAMMGWPPSRRSGGGNGGGLNQTLGQMTLAVLLVAMNLAAAPVAAADDAAGIAVEDTVTESSTKEQKTPLQVFVMPADGGQTGTPAGSPDDATVLVPEELFRVLVRGEDARGLAAVRVLAVKVTAAGPSEVDGPWTAWRLTVDIDADTGGILLLDQTGSGARFTPGSLRIDGGSAPARLDGDGSLLRIVVPDSGRHTMTVDVDAACLRRGDVETATISLPLAPAAALEFLPPPGRPAAAGVICERAPAVGGFSAAPRRSADALVFDVSMSTQVRLVRSVLAGVELASPPPTAVSRNDIFWNLDECRLTAVYDIDGGDAVVRSCVVKADPGLEWITPPGWQNNQNSAASQDDGKSADRVSIRPLGGQRFLVERQRPERGRFRVEIPFRMPLADPVGVFDVPAAWLDDALVDVRSVRFVASPSLSVRIDLPAGLTHAALPDGDTSFETRFWRSEVSRDIAINAVPGSTGSPAALSTVALPTSRARLTSERRRQEIRGSQREAVVFARDQVRIHLDARLDASSTALVTIPLDVPERCLIDRIELFEDDVLHPETAERGAIDLRWSRATDAGVTAVVQRPRAGRFRLEVDARIPGAPAARGSMPCLRIGLADGSRTLIEWQAEDGLQATLELPASEETVTRGHGEPAHAGQFELVAGDTPPTYVLESSPASSLSPEVEADPTPAAPVEDADGQNGCVELADIRLAVDERGRAWGLACFEMVSADQFVRIQLPRSWRLFDTVVDGRPVDCIVTTEASADNIWEMRLHDGGRPRSVVALFAGELVVGQQGRQLLDGEPLALSPPHIVGLDCRQTIWTVHVPPGITLRVAAPSRVVTLGDLQEERRAAQQRLRDDVQQAIEMSAGWQQDRARAFLDSRRDGVSVVADQAWDRALTALSAPFPQSPPVGIVAENEAAGTVAGQITIRVIRQRDPTAWGRAMATLSLLACGGLAWMAARSGWSLQPAVWMRVISALVLLAGGVWTALLVPMWPGLLLMVGGAVASLRSWPTPQRAVAVEADKSNRPLATTVYRPPQP